MGVRRHVERVAAEIGLSVVVSESADSIRPMVSVAGEKQAGRPHLLSVEALMDPNYLRAVLRRLKTEADKA